MNPEIVHLSYSGLSTYQTCPEQFRLQKVEHLDGAPGWYNCGGNAVHAMTADLDMSTFTGVPVTRSFGEYFDEAIATAETESGYRSTEFKAAGRKTKAEPDGEGEVWWRMNGPSYVASWQRWMKNSPFVVWITPDSEPAIELTYENQIGEVPSKGGIDRILQHVETGRLGVVDLKTKRKDPDNTIQLGVYAEHCLQQGWPIEWGGFWMARTGILTGMHDLGPVTGRRLEYDFSQAWKAIHADIFPPRPSGLCANHCSVAEYCYAGGKLKNLDHLPFPIEER